MAYAIKITYQKTKVSILVKFLLEISLPSFSILLSAKHACFSIFTR
jgi:hypothetical protein